MSTYATNTTSGSITSSGSAISGLLTFTSTGVPFDSTGLPLNSYKLYQKYPEVGLQWPLVTEPNQLIIDQLKEMGFSPNEKSPFAIHNQAIEFLIGLQEALELIKEDAAGMERIIEQYGCF